MTSDKGLQTQTKKKKKGKSKINRRQISLPVSDKGMQVLRRTKEKDDDYNEDKR